MNNGRWHSEGKFLVDPQGQTVGEIDADKIGEVVTALDAYATMLAIPRRTYHGWLVIAETEQGCRPSVTVEWNEPGKDRQSVMMKMKGNSGCTQAIEWWDARVGKQVKLEPLGAFGYRVYTDEKG